MVELIISEKPKSALRIAEALADSRAKKEVYKKRVPYYRLKHDGKDVIVASAVGHLFGLGEKQKNGWVYPVFDIVWKPIYEVNKEAQFSKDYAELLKKLSKDADKFTIACDYDAEGEVIGLNIVRFICNQKDARRMKFSTLTKPDLVESYENASSTLDWGQALAGETRHKLDWYWGINLSRALTSSVKTAGRFKILSIGRVQGPALKIIADREREIMAFKPVPFWQLILEGMVKSGVINALHKKGQFWNEKDADGTLKRVKGRDGTVSDVKISEFNQAPPFPFDLTTLQVEAYRNFGLNPSATLSIAQDLYISGLISYPRTSSQQLSEKIGYARIMNAIGKQKEYSKLCSELLKMKLSPNNGRKTDPAHPAIYPTGLIPEKIDERQRRVYDLIVRRFLATFAKPAVRETVTVKIDVAGEIFIATGTRTKEKGWHHYYEPYVKLKEEELPKVVNGEKVTNVKIKKVDDETKPPRRYTQASLVKELEKYGLGTKATRSEIIDILFRRGYAQGKAIEATILGIKTVETLEKFSPEIIDVKLTRHFEEEMEQIQEKKKDRDVVLDEAKEIIKKILKKFMDKEKRIGESLAEANKETIEKEMTVGKCHACSGTLKIKRGRFGRFVACDNYPDCKITFKLPSSGLVKTSEKVCEKCGYPMIVMIRKGKKPQDACINPDCPGKKVSREEAKEIKGRKCPKCGKELVLRKSVYGSFLGCSSYPKCRYTERLKNGSSK